MNGISEIPCNVNLKTGYHGEIISDSALNYKIALPYEDPRTLEINSIFEDEVPDNIINESASIHTINSSILFQRKLTVDEISTNIIKYLNHRNLQFNSRENFAKYDFWYKKIKHSIALKQPISIIIPIFCNIGNPLKRFQVTDITYAEKVTLTHLQNIAKEGEKVYPYGFKFEIVADANFYSTPFMNNVIETHNYINNLKKYVLNSGYSRNLEIRDMMDIISNDSHRFTEKFHFWMEKIENNKSEDLSAWKNSMISSINLRHFHDYNEIRKCYSNQKSEIRDYIEGRATSSLAIYRSLKNAAADISWEHLVSENFIRSTIHTKEIPVLGLRIYPEYKKSSKLLPYHGIAVFSKKNEKYRMKILTEMEAVSLPNILKIKGKDGLTQGYIYNDFDK